MKMKLFLSPYLAYAIASVSIKLDEGGLQKFFANESNELTGWFRFSQKNFSTTQPALVH